MTEGARDDRMQAPSKEWFRHRCRAVLSRYGPGAEDFEEDAVLLDGVEDGLDARVSGVAVEFDEEEVVPGAALRGARVNAAEVEVGFGAEVDHVAQGADAIADAEADGRLVAAARLLAGLGA